MSIRGLIFSIVLALALCSTANGQTRAIHANIRGVDIGQVRTAEDIKRQFPDYPVQVNLGVSSYRYQETYDYVTVSNYDFSGPYGGTGTIKYTLLDGKIILVELNLSSTEGLDRKEFYKHLYSAIYSEYGIWDRGLERLVMDGDADTFDSDAPPLVSIQGFASAYLWTGANGVNLFLEYIEYGGQCKIKYTAPRSYTSRASRVSSLLDKLDSSTL